MQTIQTAFTLGKTALPRTAILAPMAGVADRAYRLLCRSFGAAATVSEMVSVKGLCYGDKGSAELCTITEPERPMGLQLFGSEPEFVGKAAALVQQYEPDWIDINMGCPVHKVVATGAGSALMRNIPLAQEIVRAAVRESSVPVTVKFRLGWDENSINAVPFAQAMEAARCRRNYRTRQNQIPAVQRQSRLERHSGSQAGSVHSRHRQRRCADCGGLPCTV